MVRKNWFMMLLCLCMLCLTAAGCGTGGAASPESSPSGQETVQQDPNQGADSSDKGEAGVGTVISGADSAAAAGALLKLENMSKVRIPYTENRSSVVYITSTAEVPDYHGLEQYDDAFFEDHALLLVTETVSSGSTDVGILSVNANSLVGTVTLYHEPPGEGQDGTTDMATWVIWAEVEAGLNCKWTVANPALAPDTAAQ